MAEKEDSEETEILEIPESYQRYLDIIHDISKTKRGGWVLNKEIAESLGIKPASVSGMLDKLKKEDLIQWEPRRAIRLTEKGKNLALELNEIHSLLRIFFEKILGIQNSELVEKVTCEIEHHITPKVKDSLRKFLTNYQE